MKFRDLTLENITVLCTLCGLISFGRTRLASANTEWTVREKPKVSARELNGRTEGDEYEGFVRR